MREVKIVNKKFSMFHVENFLVPKMMTCQSIIATVIPEINAWLKKCEWGKSDLW